MYYVEFKRIKLLGFIIILFFTFSFLSFSVGAEDELVLLPDDEQTVNNDFSEDDGAQTSTIVKRKIRSKRMPSLNDRVFIPSNDNATFNGLVMRVSLIIFALLGFLVLVKMFMSREQFGKPGSLLDELAQKFTGGFSNTQGLKLKQTLILTPGQNLYLVEIDGKRLLVGGTQQGGVQFLTDLTKNMAKNENLDFKQIEEAPKALSGIALSNGLNRNNNKSMTVIENPFMEGQDSLANKNLPDEIKQKVVVDGIVGRQTFKRRTNFRKSLFNENVNHAEELLRKA